MLDDQCLTFLPRFNYEGQSAVLLGRCLLKEGHAEGEHLAYLYNPFRSHFLLWQRDDENDDGSDGYEDYVARNLSIRHGLKLLYKTWGNQARDMIEEIKKDVMLK